MKKILKRLGKIVLIIVMVIFLLLLIVPLLFKDKIGEQVVKIANQKIEAELSFSGFSVSLIRNFPNFTFSLNDLVITGKDKFEGDTLAGLKSFRLVFDLSSLLGKEGYRVKSVVINKPVINGIALADGSVNWDIMKEGEEPAESEASSSLKATLQSVLIKNGRISYRDEEFDMQVYIGNINLSLAGNMAESITNLEMQVAIDGLRFIMGGTTYLREAVVKGAFDLSADLERMRFDLNANSLSLNALLLTLTGSVEMDGDRIITDLAFGTGETGFKDILSMVPAVYMTGFEEMKADGIVTLSGTASGVYSGADSLYPDINIGLIVQNGSVSYPDLPGEITAISAIFNATFAGSDPDMSVVDLEKFSFEMGGNPFEMKFSLRTPLSDPLVSGMAAGRIDLSSFAEAVPLEGAEISGLLVTDLFFGGRYSMIEQERYDEFRADGSLSVTNISVQAEGIPPVAVPSGKMRFSPAVTFLENLKINIGGSDIALSGRLENYIPYLFRDETIRGSLNLSSTLIDAGEILTYFPSDTTVGEEEMMLPDQIIIPANIDFVFSSVIEELRFPPLEASHIRGSIVVRDGMVSIVNASLIAVGGSFNVDALYDTRDTLNPVVSGSMSAANISLVDAFQTFNTIQKLAPVAEGMAGDISADFEFRSSLGKGLMPVIDSISGKGTFGSREITLVSSPVFEKFSSLFKLDDSFSNRFKDVDVSFTVNNGRMYIEPFQTNLGVIGMTISGDHGIDQTINYNIRSEMPSRYLPEALKGVINSLAAQAAILGVQYKMPETLKVNMKVDGTATSPRIAPSLDGSGAAGGTSLKESALEAVSDAVNELIGDTRAKIDEELAVRVEKLMADAEKHAARVREEAAKIATGIRNEADSSAVKLLKEAETKGAIAKMAAERGARALREEGDKRALQVEAEADKRATAIIEEARKRAGELK